MCGRFDLERFSRSKILVLGDVMLDRYLWGDVRRISPEAPVPVFHIKRKSEVPGGAGNVVANLAGLGGSVTVIGVCGNDPRGERLSRLLNNGRVESHILVDPDRPTVTKTRIISHGQQLLRLDEEEVAPVGEHIETSIIELVETALPRCDAVILSDYGKGLLRGKRLPRLVIDFAKERGVPVIVDPKGGDWERYQGATCVTPNVGELEAVHGDAAADKERLLQAMGSILNKYDLTWLVVTRGPLGVCLMNRDSGPIFVPALTRQVYDVSGAGDTVIATLGLAVGAGLTFPDAAKLANLAAGIVVAKVGTQPINLFELQASLETSGVDGATTDAARKLASLSAAIIQVDAWKASGQKVVFTNGCFDLLHPGHIHLLNQAKNLGDRLVVAVNSDNSVRRLKGPKRPILAERDRASLLASLHCVDLVLLFGADTPEDLLKTLKPHVLVKGADYKPEQVVGRQIVEAHGGQVQLVPLLTGYSTTAITKRMLQVHHSIQP